MLLRNNYTEGSSKSNTFSWSRVHQMSARWALFNALLMTRSQEGREGCQRETHSLQQQNNTLVYERWTPLRRDQAVLREVGIPPIFTALKWMQYRTAAVTSAYGGFVKHGRVICLHFRRVWSISCDPAVIAFKIPRLLFKITPILHETTITLPSRFFILYSWFSSSNVRSYRPERT